MFMTHPEHSFAPTVSPLDSLCCEEAHEKQALLVKNSSWHTHQHIKNVNMTTELAFHLHSLLMSLRSATHPVEFLFHMMDQCTVDGPTHFYCDNNMWQN